MHFDFIFCKHSQRPFIINIDFRKQQKLVVGSPTHEHLSLTKTMNS